ncbi:hypothetical protein JD844_001382 [Phrynosoma platyrhinos]|uniref:Translational activator of cytochrome c oxidase 1 n=1 Tax=Phrynosoma platyrhinos TaxID=52577 RepID=A0ABQ7T9L2_PHRPL|nr:hypothetical protein JD844_001382 [Phrynosoma platyrhinos]
MSVGITLTRANVLFRQHLFTLLDNPSRTIHASCAAFAGHNKWSKVKHVKGPKDMARSRLFQKLTMMIRLAVKEGGPNPELNSNLANVLEHCRSKSMPKSSIEAAITGGVCSLYVWVLWPPSLGIHADGARHSFEKKGVVAVSKEDRSGSPVSLDRAVELAIEAGAEDVQEEEDEDGKMMLKFICAVPKLRQVREKLELLGLSSLSASLEFIPTVSTQLTDEDMERTSQLLEALRDCLDVVRVYDNIV